MNNDVMGDGTVKRYAVKVNGVIVSPPYDTITAAEGAKGHLSESAQSIAEIVPVTANGQEMLFG